MNVCIIIVNWNGYSVTRDCIISLKNINFSNYKLLVIDNGSSDGSTNKLRGEFPDVDFLQLDTNYGFTGGNNRGIDYAIQKYDPEYFLLLNNDTTVDKDFLLAMMDVIQKDKKIGVVVPKIYYFDKPGYLYYAGGGINKLLGIGTHYGWKKKDNGQYDITKEITFANGCAMLIKKEVIKTVGKLDNIFFATGEDIDFSYRVMKSGYKIFYAHKALIWHHEGFTGKNNKGEFFRFYIATRSIIILQKKHLNKILFVVFLFVFFVRWFLYLQIKYAIKADWQLNKSIFQGIVDGFTGNARYFKTEK